MKLRALLLASSLIAVMIVSDQSVSASSNRVRTVPKESKDQKEKKSEPKASAPKQLTTSTASLMSPKVTENNFTARNCSQSKTDPCDKLLAQGGVAK